MARLQQGENFQEAPIVGVDGQPVEQSAPAPNAPKFGPKQIAIGAGIAVILIVIIVLLCTKQGDNETSSVEQTESVNSGWEDDDWFFEENTDTTSVDPEWEVKPADPITDPYLYSIYTAEEVSWLRGYGYTGDEIEYHSQQGTSYDELVSRANAEKDRANDAWRQTVINEESEGYKALMNKTYMGSSETPSTVDKSKIHTYSSYTENVDYEKCGVYSYQPWVKLYTSIGPLFMNVALDRYQRLADTGNIVITYTYAADSEGRVLFITDIKEKAI